MSQSSVAAPLCWVDGRLVGDAPSVRATDHGLTVGDGVFETCKVVDGRPFALTRHLARLARSTSTWCARGSPRFSLRRTCPSVGCVSR